MSYVSFFSLRSSQGSQATCSYDAVTMLFHIHTKFFSLVSLNTKPFPALCHSLKLTLLKSPGQLCGGMPFSLDLRDCFPIKVRLNIFDRTLYIMLGLQYFIHSGKHVMSVCPILMICLISWLCWCPLGIFKIKKYLLSLQIKCLWHDVLKLCEYLVLQ